MSIKPEVTLLRPANKIEGYIAQTDEILGMKIGRNINLIGWNVYLKYSSKDTIKILSEWVSKRMTYTF